MAKQSELREHVSACTDPACQATKKLLQLGAVLRLGRGRHCEIAVVAAAGNRGLEEHEIVAARRRYAQHLGLKLLGPVQDADAPIHVHHAIENTPRNPAARSAINLGKAEARREGTKYVVRFDRSFS